MLNGILVRADGLRIARALLLIGFAFESALDLLVQGLPSVMFLQKALLRDGFLDGVLLLFAEDVLHLLDFVLDGARLLLDFLSDGEDIKVFVGTLDALGHALCSLIVFHMFI